MTFESKIERGEGNFYHCTDYESAVNAANEWQSENLKEIETLGKVSNNALKLLNEYKDEHKGMKFVLSQNKMEIEAKNKRIAELEAGLKKIANTSDDAPQAMRVIAKELLK